MLTIHALHQTQSVVLISLRLYDPRTLAIFVRAQRRERERQQKEEADRLAKELAEKLALEEKAKAEAEEAARIAKEAEV